MKIVKAVIVIALLSMVISANVFAQQEMSRPKSAYEKFLSNKGTMITKDFYLMPELDSADQKVEAKVVKLTSAKGSQFFYSLSIKAQYGDKSAIIAKEDLTEISKALITIINQSKQESTMELEYRERYFETNDGFKIGYYQIGTNQTFFIDLNGYQSDDTVYFAGFRKLELAISQAIVRISELGGEL